MENSINHDRQYVLIGVGVNFKLLDSAEIDVPWTDLSKVVKKLPNLQKITASLINNILKMSEDFETNGLSYLRNHWESYDMLKGVKIKSKESNKEFQGTIDGINHQGGLRVLTEDGVRELYSSMHIEYI